ncbi:ResB protein required for cytochrome c biosynthesis [Hyella patelloides LEGE 07179]|uniref:ResB protein required for cytochrome c biosynthesis n=1 Tax=Hyella patelloides LEGE 07179 TaxID=945734 RepID=A0A563W378_9CYAN|nr:cytochrome c biogenesis protein ResB [Hyella patelloides]VEP18142.1 ResB protein required for cytochrome c biosynthesis [Hyella patelloides LEGE 07179]
MFDRIIRFLSSIKLAIPLLSAIIGVLIWATFYESEVGTTTVQQEIYKSPWFGALMFLLALNLGMSALSRYPWRGARKIGFAITHIGLVVIIAGSAAVIHLGVEGMLLVRTDSDANNQVRIEGDTLEVMTPDGNIEQANIFIKDDGTINPQYVGGLELKAYSEDTVRTVNFVEGGKIANPAVTLSLYSDRMGQAVERSLAVAPKGYDTLAIGPAELDIIKVNSDRELKQLLNSPTEAKQPLWGEITVNYGDRDELIDVQQQLDKVIKIKDLQVKIIKFFPDFRLDENNRPISASDRLNNPGVLLELANDETVERWFVFGNTAIAPIHATISGTTIDNLQVAYQIQPPQVTDFFKVIVAEDNQLYYAAKSSQGFKSGTYTIGEAVTPGWADFQITLQEYIPNAQLKRNIVISNEPGLESAPALLVKTKTGKETWIPWAEPTAIEDGDREIYAAFSPKLLEIPFGVKLEDFIVDRNEGSESVAMWTSKIRIDDAITNQSQQRKVWMNHPTWYKGWKIAQASWNPGDLKQSTLQVKREPAWVTATTWLGSILVVMGIAVIFYAPALTKKWRKWQKNQPDTATEDPENKELAAT